MSYNGYEGFQNPYYRPSYQMPQVPQMPVQQPQQRMDYLVQVTGIDGARAYTVPANSRVALFDVNEPVFYIKETDAGGYPTLKRFVFQEDTGQQSQPDPMYATKDELESLRQQIEELRSSFDAKPAVSKPRTTKPAE